MTRVDIAVEKPSMSEPPRPVSAPPQYTSQVQLDNADETKQSSVWYVLSILSTIFCCLPCGVVGVIHAMLAQHDGELARLGPQRTRLRKARFCTCVSFGLGLVAYGLIIAWMAFNICDKYDNYSWLNGKHGSAKDMALDEPYYDSIYEDLEMETTPFPTLENIDDSMEESEEHTFLPPILDELIPESWLMSDEEDDEDFDDGNEERSGLRENVESESSWGSHGEGGTWEDSEEEEGSHEWNWGNIWGLWSGVRNGERGRGNHNSRPRPIYRK